MKRYLPKNAEDASALILTLLVIVLLSTIITSFLSTSRTEQTATRNYTSKTQAEQFAISATQQAMANIQSAFNGNGTGTAIVVSQPGAVSKYFASNGVLTGNKTDLFFTASSINANGTVDMNNLSNATSVAGLITGNPAEAVNVYQVDVKSGNQIVGRIAYYIDDEGTKVNLNSASSNRSTVNVGNARPLSLFGANLSSSAGLTKFDAIVAGSSSATSNMSSWAYFFRPEQAIGAGVLTVNSTMAIASVSTTSGGNSTLTKTPWGTDRIYINSLSTNATDGTGDASVRSIYEALTGKNATSGSSSNSTYGLTGQALSNIYGASFADKYTPIGVKQIAANMLQMRDPNTATVNASFSYQGPLIGAGGNASLNSSTTIPQEYLGFAPYPFVSEVSMDVCYNNSGGNNTYLRPYVRVNVELYNPYPVAFNSPNATLEYHVRGLTWNMTYTINSTGQSFGPHRYGGYGNWTDNSSSKEYWSRADLRDQARSNTQFPEAYFSGWNPWGAQGISIPAYSKVKYNLAGPNWGTYGQALLAGVFPFNASDITITSFTDLRCAITYVKILANSIISTTPPNTNTVRDWVMGAEVGPFIPNNGNLSVVGGFTYWKGVHQTLPLNTPIDFPRNGAVPDFNANNDNISKYSYQRLCPLIRTSMAASSNLTASTRAWTANASTANQTFGNASSASGITTTNSTEQFNQANANPNFDSSNAIPSDPSYNNFNGNAVYANATLTSDMRIPELPSISGNYIYSCPADLGLVPTNQRWRRLRMQPQPPSESASGLIPDWAMLDVIAFGRSAASINYTFSPVNPNGQFNVAAGPTPAPRTAGLKALVQTLDTNSSNATLADPMNPSGNITIGKTRFMGSTTANATAAIVAGNIANMTWSANSKWGNSSSNSTSYRRNALKFPSNCFLLPSEICEINGVADVVSQTNYTNTTNHFKWNEGRVSAILPGLSTCSSFFTIFAYAQAGQVVNGAFVPESEHVTRTLVEVTNVSGNYTVKPIYTQPIRIE